VASQPRSLARRTRGVSLIELMVGLVIGMIAVLVVMQVFQISESSRRTTVGGDDAQMAGMLSLSALHRDIQQAGYGASAFPIVGCSITLPGGWTVPALAPVTINPAGIPAGDANTDIVMVIYGDNGGSPEGDLVAAQAVQTTYSVATPTSFAANDFIVAAVTPRPVVCNLTLEAVTVKSDSPPTVTVGTGVAGMINGTLYNFGRDPRFQVYAVRNGNLTVCDYRVNNCGAAASAGDPTVWVPVSNGVVSLRAVYGKDTTVPMDSAVDLYDRVAPASACDYARVSALQVALVTQSGEFDKQLGAEIPFAAAPEWRASDAAPIDLSARADWQSFRYKVYETTVPVRNMAWQGAQSGC
jgi:type IV pilus assembly protein PilW